MNWWTNKQVEYLTERWAAGDSYNAIADGMTLRGWPVRTAEAVCSKRKKLGLPSRPRPSAKSRRARKALVDIVWPADRQDALDRARKAGLTYRATAKSLGVSIGAVSGRIWRLKKAEARNAA